MGSRRKAALASGEPGQRDPLDWLRVAAIAALNRNYILFFRVDTGASIRIGSEGDRIDRYVTTPRRTPYQRFGFFLGRGAARLI